MDGDDIKFEDLLVFDNTLNTLTSEECEISLDKFHVHATPCWKNTVVKRIVHAHVSKSTN